MQNRLKLAIEKGDLPEIEKILTLRNAAGLPFVRINDLPGQLNAFWYAIHIAKGAKFDAKSTTNRPAGENATELANNAMHITRYLLSLRDADNYPLINPHQHFPGKRTVTHLLVEDAEFTPEEKEELTRSLFDKLRMPNGECAFHPISEEITATQDEINQQHERLKIIDQTLQDRWLLIELPPTKLFIALTQSIESLSTLDGFSEQHKADLAVLKQAAKTTHSADSKCSLEEDYIALKQHYVDFHEKNKADLMRLIQSRAELEDKSIKQALYKQLNLIEEKSDESVTLAATEKYKQLYEVISAIESISGLYDEMNQQAHLVPLARELITAWITYHINTIQHPTQFSSVNGAIVTSQQSWATLNNAIQQVFNKISALKLPIAQQAAFQNLFAQLTKTHFNTEIHHLLFTEICQHTHVYIEKQFQPIHCLAELILGVQDLAEDSNPLVVQASALLKERANRQLTESDFQLSYTNLNTHCFAYQILCKKLDEFVIFTTSLRSSIAQQITQKFLDQFKPACFADYMKLDAITWVQSIDPYLRHLERLESNFKNEYARTCVDLTWFKHKALKSLTTDLLDRINRTDTNDDFSKPEVIKAKLLSALNQFKKSDDYKQLSRSRSWRHAYAALKNALMLLTPIFGWAYLAYRAYKGQTFFETRPRSQRCVDTLRESIIRAPAITAH